MQNQITQRKNLAVKGFFDEETNTVTYLVWDKKSLEAAVIDPVFDFNNLTGSANTHSASSDQGYLARNSCSCHVCSCFLVYFSISVHELFL